MTQESLPHQLILKELEKVNTDILVPKKRHLFFEKGASPFDSFDTLKYFYFILDGKIKVSQINIENAKEQTLYLLSRGDMFDVVSLLDSQEHEYVAEVLEPSKLIEVPIEQVRYLLDNDADFKQLFFPYLATQLRNMENLAVDLSLYDVYERLIRLFARFADYNEKHPSLKLIGNISHEELAGMVGSVRKVVNRALQKLKDEGIVELSRKQIHLKDLQKLLEKLHF
jgi:CRP/FNR family transcriptional regulator, cyclic AMP receptor protein